MVQPRIVTLLFVLGASACAAPNPEPTDDTEDTEPTGDTDTDTDTVEVEETGLTDTDETGAGFEVAFTSQRFKVTTLRILPPDRGIDLDGTDPEPDNQIAVLLNLVDSVLGAQFGGFSISDVNLRIDDMLFSERAIVLMEGRYQGGQLVIDVVRGERNLDGNLVALADSYDGSGNANEQMRGTFVDVADFEAGPNPLSIPIQFYPDEPLIIVSSASAQMEGMIDDEEIDARIAGAFKVDEIMNGIVEPLIGAYFSDPSEAEGWNNTIRGLVELQADLMVGDEPALSGAFTYEAEATSWEPPTP